MLCAASMILGTAGYASVSSLPFLFLFISFIGFGLGTLELCGSNIITTYYPEKKGRYLNMLTAISGIGSILSPILASQLLRRRTFLAFCLLYGTCSSDTDCSLLYLHTRSKAEWRFR
ncbi:MAG: MFS transporter [Lachnospiraceae bacterium]